MTSPKGRLLEHVVWRLEVLTPLHAGSGVKLERGFDVECAEGHTFAIDIDKLADALPPGRHDQIGRQFVRDLYAGRPLRALQRYVVRGEVRGRELLCFARDGFDRPYLPGSTLKGALRTALLMQLAEERQEVKRALRVAAGRVPDRKEKDFEAQRAAFRLDGGEESTDDVLRHLHVPDVLIPPAAIEVVEVLIASMDERDHWRWKTAKRDAPNAIDPHDRDVLRLSVEVVRPGTVLYVPLRVDAQRLRPDWMKRRPGQPAPQDFSGWAALLQRGLLDAVASHGRRVLDPEIAMWSRSRPHDNAAQATKRIAEQAKQGGAIFPVGWGIGWRGMTGAALERLDDNAERVDAGNQDPPLITRARNTYSKAFTKGDFHVFPKSRRLWVESRSRAPQGPLGWVAVRSWGPQDKATPFTQNQGPEGKLPIAGSAKPFYPGTHPPGKATTAPRASTTPQKGDRVRCRLTGKTKKGKWQAELLDHSVRGVVDGDREGAVEGAEVELEVKNTSAGQDWGLVWPSKKE